MWAWGLNENGTLGNGSNTLQLLPIKVPGIEGVAQVAAGSNASFALKLDGTVMGWGLLYTAYSAHSFQDAPVRNPIPITGLSNQNFIASGGGDGYIYGVLSLSVQAPQLVSNITSNNVSQPYSSNLKVTAKLLNTKGRGIFLRKVGFTMDGTDVGNATADGKGNVTFVVPNASKYATGAHTLKAKFAGDLFYKASAATATITITKADTKMSVPNLTLRPGDTNPLTATLAYKADNSPVVGASVKFSIDGVVTGTATTDSKGTAALPYVVDGILKMGAHTLKAEFAGDTNQTASSGTGTLTLAQAPTQVSAVDIVGKAGGTVTLTAKLVRTTDNGVLGSQVLHFQIDGVEVGTGTTNSTGTAAYKYRIPSTMKKGKHPIKVIFNGDTLYQTSNDATKNLTVN